MTKKNKDFLDFSNSKSNLVPEKLTENILGLVKSDLNPEHKIVFLKLVTIQVAVGIITLLFCPQFNMSLTNNHEVFHYFHHKFGEQVCMAICGSIFVGSGALVASFLLKINEIKKISESKFLYYFSITSLMLTSFILLGAQVYFSLALFWSIGATLSGIALFEINKKIRISLTS